ncbi:MAG: MBL fold metallo-hydrolase [Acidimicrobiia bacterium]|nr:MAG: MBL fold metallo-hydrolase [Acidimicrobiia bacterium]
MIEVADRVYRLGAKLVNWYLIEDGGRFTVIDAGLPTQFDQLPAALSSQGASIADVEAVVLTHAHADHLGSSARIKDEGGAAVRVHDEDAALARGEAEREVERPFIKDLVHWFAWKSVVFFVRGGAMKSVPVAEVSTFSDGEVLDLPGKPRVIHTPGHTRGSASIQVGDRGVLFTGDALVTLNISTGVTGPRIMPGSFNWSSEKCLDSLSPLEGIEADLILPGHGEPWSGSVSDAITAARQVGPS